MTPFEHPAPRWFSIAPHRPFLADLASGLALALASGGPRALSDAVVLAPSRRAARGLAEAFVAVGGGRALLLPQIRALGDLDEGEPPFEPGDIALDLPPAISPWRRRFELVRLVAANDHLIGRALDATGALELADALGALLDGIALDEPPSLSAPSEWVTGEMALHWEISARFLALALSAWPKRLAELGVVDGMTRRVALTHALASHWRAQPPRGVLVAAGSTGSSPATSALLAAIAAAPRGLVVLPGLDQDLADDAWAGIGDQHPQSAMKRLLDQAGVARGDVGVWSPPESGDARGRWRRRVINEALRPPEATADWLKSIGDLRAEGARDGVDPVAEGLAGLSLVTARNEEEAAQVAALALREVLETPGRTAALITPDAAMARRVSARLARWGVIVDSSAGAALAGAPIGQLVALAARQSADPLDPVGLLAILKHRLADLGAGERALERRGLRGPRPRGWAELETRLAEGDGRDLLEQLRAALAPAAAAFASGSAAVTDAARGLAETLDALGGDALWAGPDGAAAAALLAALIGESDGMPVVTPRGFAELVQSLLAAEIVRAGGAVHPRLRILGVLEGRLIDADRLILAGLEEGVWPQVPPADPFLSRPMREALGLAAPERRIGLSAHDFAQAAAQPEVMLLTTARRGGAPAPPSRWLWRLTTLAAGAKTRIPDRPDLIAWARALDAPDPIASAARPHPKPPVETRPDTMAVTAVERWVRDPYAVYARDILRLRPLARPAEPIDARARGSAAHKALERFASEDIGEAAHARFAELVIEELEEAGMPHARLAREYALARNAAPWAVEFERRRRQGARLLIEQSGALTFARRGGTPFTVTAKADRIEARGETGDVLDFKTGSAPTQKQVRSGLSPQLTLTAAILAHGGFAEIGALQPGQLVYVRILASGEGNREEVRAEPGESSRMADDALAGLKRRVAFFDDPDTAYVSWAAPQFIDRYQGDYDHLARLWEWFVIGEDDDE